MPDDLVFVPDWRWVLVVAGWLCGVIGLAAWYRRRIVRSRTERAEQAARERAEARLRAALADVAETHRINRRSPAAEGGEGRDVGGELSPGKLR